MAKFGTFDVTVKLKELEIHVKGDRELAPEIANNVAQHISGVFQPSALIDTPKSEHNGHQVIEGNPSLAVRRKRRSSGVARATTNGSDSVTPDWIHEPEKWGSPLQTWKQSQKIAWLLFVLEQATGKKDLTPAEMTDLFRRKFREAGLLARTNIPRDLGKQSDNFGVADGRWFLKQGGREVAEKLIAEARGVKVAV